jgi:RNA polymerase sigma-70 factor (ECF subfamily)
MNTASAQPVQPEAGPTIEFLWREFADLLRGFLRHRVSSPQDAEDLLQAVFLKIHRQLPTLRDTSKIQGWAYRIARNVVIDHYRTRRENTPFTPEMEAADPSGRDVVDLTPALTRFITQLPPIYREALVRHEYQGEEIKTVAAALGISPTAAKSRVRRARLLLREMLERCCQFEFDQRGRVIEATPRQACECDCASTKRNDGTSSKC